MSLIIQNDAPDTRHGGHLSLVVEGLEEGNITVGEENAGILNGWHFGSKGDVDVDEDPLALEMFYWKWRKHANDGLVVEDINPELCITVRPRTWRHMDGFAMTSGTGETVYLPSKSEDFTLCKALSCEPGVL